MRMRIVVLALAVLALGGQAQAAGPPPLRVLFVGNSLTATNDLPGMVDVLASYRNAARAARAELFPAGDAWRSAWRRDPKLPLYGSDGFHPSRLGSYLAAVVIYAGLVKASPVGLPRLWVSAKRARVLQAAAAEALRRT